MSPNAAVFAIVSFMLAFNPNDAWIFCKNEGRITEMRLHATTKPEVRVHIVNAHSSQDILDLADMRYSEWMVHGEGASEKTPTLGAFRMATAEIVQERAQEGALQFLARMVSSSKNEPKEKTAIVVGSAELSPIELKGAISVSHLAENRKFLYVTDVVTSPTHRRLGVGTVLMDAIERAATLRFNATRIYLHICPENTGAMEFYFRRGFQKTTICSEAVDATKLAEAAGAGGQILLQKELGIGDNHDEQMHKRNSTNKQINGGDNNGFAKRKRANA